MGELKTRGVMYDLARGMERKSFYIEILPWLKEWGYTLLHLHLTDDQGCRLVFPRRPELASEGAFTAAEMRTLVREAKRLGIDVMPEIESLGHTGFVTGRRRYKELGGPNPGKHVFNAIDPDHAETRRLLSDLFADAAEIFDGEIIHAGLDEVDLTRLKRYRGRNAEDLWPVFARHAAWVHETIRKLGRRPAMWGDHLLSAPQMAAKFKKDVLVMDWHYRAEVDPATLDLLANAGFEVWAAPATMWWYVRLLSGAGTVRNVREFVAHARQPQRPRVTGAVNTTWCSWRYLPGALDWPVAWAGHVMSSEAESEGFCREFCQTYYGLGRGVAAGAAAALLALYALAPDTPRLDAVMNGGVACTRERVRECRAMLPGLRAAVKTLEKALPAARRNGERLRDVVLSGQLLERWATLGALGPGKSPRKAGEKLAAACEARWATERPYPTPVFPAAGKWQHVVLLARGLV